ncbi:hypothetical protein F5X99DRAFT_375139 [Biscogniauxia marginata]|nr:hypothetical protein F5X99DRAFT_375139 [Biscogniauxia marginata]
MPGAGQTGMFLLRWIIAFTVICSVFVVLRFWAARITKRRFFADDLCVILAFASTIANEGVIIWAIQNGLGKPSEDVPKEELAVQAKVFAIPAAMTWLVGSVCLKLSMLFLYIRIFSIAKFRQWAYALIVVVVCYGIAFIIVFPTNCQPISQLWAPVPDGWCHNPIIEQFASVTLNLVIDLAIVILPMPALWSLKMPRSNKVFISIMFSLGLITIGVMCWRLWITAQAATTDLFGYLAAVGLVSELELWLGIIVVCMPTLRPLVTKYANTNMIKLKSTTSVSRSTSDSAHLKHLRAGQAQQSYYGSRGEHNIVDGYPQTQQAVGSTGEIRTECVHDPDAEHIDKDAMPRKIHVRQDIESYGSTEIRK